MSSPAFRRAKALKRARRTARNVIRHHEVRSHGWRHGGWWIGWSDAGRDGGVKALPRRVIKTRRKWRRLLGRPELPPAVRR